MALYTFPDKPEWDGNDMGIKPGDSIPFHLHFERLQVNYITFTLGPLQQKLLTRYPTRLAIFITFWGHLVIFIYFLFIF